MISRNELFVFWGVHVDEYGTNEWKDRVSVVLNVQDNYRDVWAVQKYVLSIVQFLANLCFYYTQLGSW